MSEKNNVNFFSDSDDDSDRTESFYINPATDSDNRPGRQYRPILIVLNGSRRGARLKLDHRETIIGRSRGAHFQIEDDGISRFHLKVLYENAQSERQSPKCLIQDLGSRNGTQINGNLIEGKYLLRERDRITIGRTILGFFLRDEEELSHDDHLYECATRDALTGLDNRRQLLSHMRHYIGLAKRGRTSIILILLDIDDFKLINDTYGHLVGDEILKHVAGILSSFIRDADLVARWGGEEFSICLMEASVAKAQAFAERVRSTLESTPFENHEEPITITASFGIAAFREGDDYDALFERADRSMYLAKESGKNRVVFEDSQSAGEKE